MNAVVALCHFCEAHGPRIVFCCQPFHDEHDAFAGSGSPSGTFQSQDFDDKKLFYGKFDDYFDVPSHENENSKSCNACRSVKSTKPGFISNDDKNRISYLGSQFPYHPEVFTIVRQACVRSLSCEVCPGREGPIFFGDEQYGYCLCHPFTLKDSKARGFQRWYSYCIVSMDKLLLLNFYDLLTSSLKLLVEFLQNSSRLVFDAEQSKCAENLPQIAASGRLGWLPSGFMRERAGSSSNGVARSLTELAGDPDIFGKLQRYFVWILQLPSACVVEQVLEGLPSQDELIRYESFDRNDSSVMTNGDTAEAPLTNGHKHDDDGRLSDDDNLLIASKILSERDGGNEYRDLAVSNLRLLFHVFGSEAFKILAYHIVVGNQIVVKSESAKIARLVLDALQILLPIGCCQVCYNADEYVEAWRCNFLGLSDAIRLPEPSDDGDQFVVISAKLHNDGNHHNYRSTTNEINFILKLDYCSFRLHYVGAPPDDYPTFLDRLMLILSDSNLSVRSTERCLNVLKEEWLNKSKLLFQLTKRVAASTTPDDFSDDFLQRRKELFAKLTKCNNGGNKPIDEMVVKFWQAGLSKQYKSFVLNKISQTNNAAKASTTTTPNAAGL